MYKGTDSTANTSPVMNCFDFCKMQPKVAVLVIKGTIGEGKNINMKKTRSAIDRAFSLRGLKAVCLLINSPGGSPVQSELVAEYLVFKYDVGWRMTMMAMTPVKSVMTMNIMVIFTDPSRPASPFTPSWRTWLFPEVTSSPVLHPPS